jgi:hypothetical protein
MTVRSRVAKPTDRTAWLDVRVPYYNASAAACLHDRHPYLTVADYAIEKLAGRDYDERDETSAMRRGRHLEDGVAQWWAEENGYTVYEPDELFIADRLMATVDRIVMQTDNPVEIKTVGRHLDEPEPYWLDQCQAIMFCADADVIELVWVDASMQLRSRTVDADADFQTDLAARAERFMAAIDFGIVPDFVVPTLTAANIDSLTPELDGDPVDLGDAGLVAMERYRELQDRMKDDKSELAAIKDDVARMLGEHTIGTYMGDPIVTWNRSKTTTKLDIDALVAELDPALVAKHEYAKPGSRRFLPKARS